MDEKSLNPSEGSTKNSGHLIRKYRNGDEKGIIEVLKMAFPDADWIWKYRLNPVFDPSNIIVAEKDGKIVGCFGYLARDLKIDESLVVRVALSGDWAVHPDYRKSGIGSSLRQKGFNRMSEKFIIAYWFELRKPPFEIPNSTLVYELLNIQELRRWIASIQNRVNLHGSLRRRLSEIDLRIGFYLRGVPPFTLEICDGRLQVSEEEVSPDIKVEWDLVEARKSEFKLLRMLKALILGRLRVKGLLRHGLKLYRFLEIYKQIDSEVF